MRNTIIIKISFLLLFCTIPFCSCKNEKTFDADEIVQRVFRGEDVTIFDNYINCKIGYLSEFDDNIIRGTTYMRLNEKFTTYLWFYENESNYKQGMLILMLARYRKISGRGKNKIIKDSYFLEDYKSIQGFSENITAYYNVSYGEPIIDHGYTRYNVDENIYGIYAYEGKYPPYNKKVKPKYLVYVENNKLVVEEPKDDKYFIYRIPEL